MNRRLRIVVCGTAFGQTWIEAISGSRRYRLTAVVARGSRRSREVCRRYGVPMAGSAAEVVTPVDATVVAVGGAAGEEIALDWLRRSVPVLMEHPVSPEFLTRVLRRSGRGLRLQVNGHFRELPAVVRFIRECRAAMAGRRASAVILATPRTLYSCLDIAVSILPPRHLYRIHFRLPRRDALGDPVFRLGSLEIKVTLMPGTSARDNTAGSLGGHFIQLWLPDQRIALLGPAGPIVGLSTAAHRTATWVLLGRSRAASWSAYDATQRPAALIAALDRTVRRNDATAFRENLRRHLLVSSIGYHLLRSRGLIPWNRG